MLATVLAYVGDALWVIALAIMFGASRRAALRIPADARPPLMGARLSRGLFLWALPGAAFLFSLWLLLQARTQTGSDMALIVFGARTLVASLLAQLHLRWLGQGMKALEAEGALKP